MVRPTRGPMPRRSQRGDPPGDLFSAGLWILGHQGKYQMRLGFGTGGGFSYIDGGMVYAGWIGFREVYDRFGWTGVRLAIAHEVAHFLQYELLAAGEPDDPRG